MSNVTAEVRIRPSSAGGLDHDDRRVIVGAKTFTFSRVHEETAQEALFTGSVEPLLVRFAGGEDCAVIAYGQTGSGKTYTMLAEDGMVPRALEWVYSAGLQVVVTFAEVHCDAIVDLLSGAPRSLPVRQSGDELLVVGLHTERPETTAEALALLRRGCTQRATAATRMNAGSSRSHAIFTAVLEGPACSAQIVFVDLAGSERLKRTECSGASAREAISINRGLLALGNVISALYRGAGHVPFRDAKLTRLLARALRSQLLLLACVSADPADAAETANTLKYAACAALIDTNARVRVPVDRDKLLIAELRREISVLRDENMRLRAQLRGGAQKENTPNSRSSDDPGGPKDPKRSQNHNEYQPARARETPHQRSAENTAFNRRIPLIDEPNPVAPRTRIVSFDLRSVHTARQFGTVVPRLVGTRGHAAFAMISHGERLVAACSDGAVRGLGAREEVLFRDGAVRALAGAENTLFYSSRSLLKQFDGRSRPAPVHAFRSGISALRLAGNIAYVGHEDGSLSSFDLRAGRASCTAKMHSSAVSGIEAICGRVYTCSRDRNVSCIASEMGGKCIVLEPPHDGAVSAILAYKATLISLDREGSLRAWHGTAPLTSVPHAHDSWIRAGTLLGHCWATGCRSGVVRCWDLREGAVRPIGHADTGSPVTCMAGAGSALWVAGPKQIQMYAVEDSR